MRTTVLVTSSGGHAPVQTTYLVQNADMQCKFRGHTGLSKSYISLLIALFRVPLDYFNASAGVAKIALGRYKATGTSRKGIVVLNPGGPGGLGKRLATVTGPQFQDRVGI